jgi:ADP-ribosylation factor 2-binding protein
MSRADRDGKKMQVEALELFAGDDADFEDIVDDPQGDVEKMAESEEDICIDDGGCDADARFDAAVGALGEIVFADDFQQMITTFCKENSSIFEDTEENKLEYMPIFKNYSAMIEAHLQKELTAAVPGFSMDAFSKDLLAREDEVDGEIFELLSSIGDFANFKAQMLSFKGDRAEFSVTGKPMRLHIDEQSDGDEIPDLEILTSPIKSTPKKSGNAELPRDA